MLQIEINGAKYQAARHSSAPSPKGPRHSFRARNSWSSASNHVQGLEIHLIYYVLEWGARLFEFVYDDLAFPMPGRISDQSDRTQVLPGKLLAARVLYVPHQSHWYFNIFQERKQYTKRVHDEQTNASSTCRTRHACGLGTGQSTCTADSELVWWWHVDPQMNLFHFHAQFIFQKPPASFQWDLGCLRSSQTPKGRNLAEATIQKYGHSAGIRSCFGGSVRIL